MHTCLFWNAWLVFFLTAFKMCFLWLFFGTKTLRLIHRMLSLRWTKNPLFLTYRTRGQHWTCLAMRIPLYSLRLETLINAVEILLNVLGILLPTLPAYSCMENLSLIPKNWKRWHLLLAVPLWPSYIILVLFPRNRVPKTWEHGHPEYWVHPEFTEPISCNTNWDF
jgi:hypothetical protein